MHFYTNDNHVKMLTTLLFIITLNLISPSESKFRSDSERSHLNFDILNDKINLIEEEINMNENRNNTIITNNYHNSLQTKPKDRNTSVNVRNILKFDELSAKLKQEALIDVFKIKLLELLDLDEAPSPKDFNININPVPEPIMREYNKLLKLSHDSIQNSDSKTTAFFSRRMRDKSEHDKTSEFETADELIRFNSSIIQDITLLPHKIKNDPRFFLLNQNNDWCNSNNTHNQGLILLNCFKFSLEQKEFILNDIKSAEMYIKLELNTIKELLKLSKSDNLNDLSFLYLEVNGHIIKKIDLLKDAQNNNLNYLFEYADVKSIIENVINLNLNLNQKHHHKMSLKVRLLCSSSLTASFNPIDNEEFLRLFSNIDENVALHIKFGEQKPENRESSRYKRQQWHSSGGSNDSSSRGRGHNSRHRTGQAKQHSKNYRDCADLRKLGHTASNFSCCRETISFSMEQIGWSHWILSPKVIEYKYCRGGCVSGISPRFDNTQIVYRMFELSNTFESSHCCNIYDYEDDIPFIYGSPPNYLTKMVSLNAKTCLCS